MRDALPATVPFERCRREPRARSRSASPGWPRAASTCSAALTVDRLHEPYRAAIYPQLPQLVEAARDAGALGACLSGAGSTILAFADSLTVISRIEGAFAAAAADTDITGRVLVVAPRNAGQGQAQGLTSGSFSRPAVLARMNPSVSSHAASLASANSLALRSKKPCGASG